MKRRQSERHKANWFKKPIICPGSTKDQPLHITDDDEESLTQEAFAKGNDSKLGTYFRAIKSWNKKK
jgi:hypothetical protein